MNTLPPELVLQILNCAAKSSETSLSLCLNLAKSHRGLYAVYKANSRSLLLAHLQASMSSSDIKLVMLIGLLPELDLSETWIRGYGWGRGTTVEAVVAAERKLAAIKEQAWEQIASTQKNDLLRAELATERTLCEMYRTRAMVAGIGARAASNWETIHSNWMQVPPMPDAESTPTALYEEILAENWIMFERTPAPDEIGECDWLEILGFKSDRQEVRGMIVPRIPFLATYESYSGIPVRSHLIWRTLQVASFGDLRVERGPDAFVENMLSYPPHRGHGSALSLPDNTLLREEYTGAILKWGGLKACWEVVFGSENREGADLEEHLEKVLKYIPQYELGQIILQRA